MIAHLKRLIRRFYGRKFFPGYNEDGVPFPVAAALSGRTQIHVLDIGAHRGAFTEGLRRHCGIARGVLVEPHPKMVSDLQKGFAGSEFFVVAAAASDHTAEGIFHAYRDPNLGSLLSLDVDRNLSLGVAVDGHESIVCPVLRLDDLAMVGAMRRIDILKLDIQGAELAALRGAAEVLKKTELIWIEVSFEPLYDNSCLFREVDEFLRERHFQLLDVTPALRGPNGALVQADALYRRTGETPP